MHRVSSVSFSARLSTTANNNNKGLSAVESFLLKKKERKKERKWIRKFSSTATLTFIGQSEKKQDDIYRITNGKQKVSNDKKANKKGRLLFCISLHKIPTLIEIRRGSGSHNNSGSKSDNRNYNNNNNYNDNNNNRPHSDDNSRPQSDNNNNNKNNNNNNKTPKPDSRRRFHNPY